MPNNDRQTSGSGLKTAATFGIGALVGALAAGAAWYFAEDEQSSHQTHQHQTYQSNHPVNQELVSATNDTEKDEKDEKDGTVKVCEICFASFEELKECGVQIVATPCGHLYCRDCIGGSLRVKPECPHCRGPVVETDLRRLYM